MNILVIEDDRMTRSLIENLLLNNNYDVDGTESALNGEAKALKNAYDCIILDLALPDKNGLELCKNIRSKNVQTPILILTAHDNIDTKVTGLDFGADDYITKPFDNKELLARVNALIRRNIKETQNKGVVHHGELKIDFLNRKFYVNNNPVKLTNNEFKLMGYFMQNPDRAMDKEELSGKVWDLPVKTDSNFLNVYVRYLRRKLGEFTSRNYIETVRNVGFKFNSKPEG